MCVFQKFRPLEVFEEQQEVKLTEGLLWARPASQASTHRVLMTTTVMANL